MDQPYIGILISSLFYNELKRNKKRQIISFYEEAAKEYSLIPCFLRLEDIEPGKKQARGYVMNANGTYTLTTIPKPLVIHNRGYQTSNSAKRKIKSLQNEGILIFNEWNRYGKFQIHKLLMKRADLLPHLPETVKFNSENLKAMMKKHKELIIKPSNGTLGKRNMKATRLADERWMLQYPYRDDWLEKILTAGQLPIILKKIVANEKFLIQERIKLAEIQQNPFDIRVSVQRNEHGAWQVTGMVCKVAKDGSFVTNVARGGTCLPLNEIIKNLPQLDLEKVNSEVESLAMKIAGHLGKHIANLADIGLDIGITKEGFPMFIECNARDLRVTFRNAKLFDIWKATYMTPVGYGKYLLEKKTGQ